jgi:tripartite ATP-independent transporter DctP family solute receptor
MGRRIAERTQGRHGIRVFHSRQLGEENETIEQTRVGAIDINRINIAPLAAAAPELNVLSMPFLFRSERHLHAALDGAFGADLLASVAGHGFVGLAFYDSGARSLYNSVRPIRSVADVKGLTVRVQPSELMEAMVNAMGARAMQMAYGQVLTGLQTKIIEGAENNWPSYVSTQHYKYARYYTLTEHSMAPEIVVMSKRAWDGLDEADRAVFREAAHESSLVMREKWREVEDASRRKAAAEGNVIIADFDRKSFVDVMAPIHDRMAADARIAPLIRRVRELE